MQNVRASTSARPDAPRRGRPRGFDRAAALEAAMRLFWRKGYAAASISDLTAAMGIGSPSLYAAFGSKEALYAEALRAFGERHGPRVWERFRAAPTARAALEAYLMDSAATLAPAGAGDPPGCMVTLSAVEGEGCAALGERVRAMRAEALAALQARLRRGIAEGELPTGLDVAGVARFFLAVQGGLSLQARDGATRAELEAAARAAMAGWDALIQGTLQVYDSSVTTQA